MRAYGISEVGSYHLESGSDVCQDFHVIERISDNLYVLSVSDGVGSDEHSDLASKAACKASVDYIKAEYGNYEDKLEVLFNSFVKALESVKEESKKTGYALNSMHCTLCNLIFDNGKVYVANIGDSGAIGLNDEGNFIPLTEQQNDEEGRVYTLYSYKAWSLKECPGRFVSVMNATDGFLNFLYQPYLRMLDEDSNTPKLDVMRLEMMMDPLMLDYYPDQDSYKAHIDAMIGGIARDTTSDGIRDDLTVTILVSDLEQKNIAPVYNYYNRGELKERFHKKAMEILYPNLQQFSKSESGADVNVEGCGKQAPPEMQLQVEETSDSTADSIDQKVSQEDETDQDRESRRE